MASYFRERKFTHIVVEDDEFDRVGTMPKVKVIGGEGTCETDSLINEDLK